MIWPIFVIAVILIVVTQVFRRIHRSRVVEYETSDAEVSSSGHHFASLTENDHGRYCSLCENGMQSGMQCDFCGVMVDTALCLHSISSTVPCKIFARCTDNDITHHWVRGNLPSCSICIACEEMCGDGVGLVDYRCAWCQSTVHSDCKHSVGERCNLGTNRDFIIPPNCVTVRKAGSRKRKQLVVDSICVPNNMDASAWTPLFVVVNSKSGGAEGSEILRAFRRFLHPAQVINVEQVGIGAALRWSDMYPGICCCVIVAGGDGTVSLALDAISELHRHPPVAVLPLGTGNDLSRVLGWGSSFPGPIDFSKICADIRTANVVKLDRWAVDIVHRRRYGVRAKNKRLSMVNYLSVGVDACVTYGMQSTRESIPKVLSSRLLNKLLFFTFGTKDVLEHACADLEKKVELTVDGTVVKLPSVEGLTILNIPYWGAGVRPWGDPPEMPQAIDDGKFEVFAVRSSFHIAQMQMGVSQPLRIIQGHTLKLRIFGATLPMQCDGEAWMQQPGVIQLSHRGQASLFSKQRSPSESPLLSFFYL